MTGLHVYARAYLPDLISLQSSVFVRQIWDAQNPLVPLSKEPAFGLITDPGILPLCHRIKELFFNDFAKLWSVATKSLGFVLGSAANPDERGAVSPG